MSLAEKDSTKNSVDVEDILADFFLKKIEMKSSKSDNDSDHQKKTKHRKHRQKKSKHKSKTRSRTRSPSPFVVGKVIKIYFTFIKV